MRVKFLLWLATALAASTIGGALATAQETPASPPSSSGSAPADTSSTKSSFPALGTNVDFQRQRSFPNVLGAYSPPSVPQPSLTNSNRLQSLIRDVKLELTVDDALDLAIENNLDIDVARYQLPLAQADYLRTKGGGAARGVTGAAISSALFAGAIGGSSGGGGTGGAGGAGGFSGGGGAINTGSNGC